MTPNAAQRERNIRLREIRAYGQSAASRAVPTPSAAATVSVGGMDAGGEFVRYGRVDVDAVAIFRAAE